MNIPKKIKLNTVIISVAVLLLSAGIGYLLLQYQFKLSVDNKFKTLADSQVKLFNSNIETKRKALETELEHFILENDLPQAVAEADYQKIKDEVTEHYHHLKSIDNSIKILTFRSSDGVTLFRAHKPEFYGDKVSKSRKLINDTNRLQTSLHGFEVGKLEMTYRVTKPIFYNNTYVGNVEIGVDPAVYIENLNEIFKLAMVEIGVAVDKSLLKIMIDPDVVPINDKYLLISGSKRLKHYFTQSPTERSAQFKVKMDIPLNNHLNETIGYLVLCFDSSAMIKQDREFMYSMFFTMFVLLLFLVAVVFKGFNRILKYITDQAYMDSLTGLKNRAALKNELDSKQEYTLILSNIKDFSLVNQLYGTEIGNKVLITVAHAFRDFAEKHNFDVFRVSSDEYVLLKEEEYFDVFEYNELIIDLQKQINSLVIWIDKLEDSISIEILSGVSHGNSRALEDAQMAMKMAKESHLPYLAYAERLDTKKQSEIIISMKKTIRNALEQNNVIPFFQPICNAEGKIVKYEALIRIVEFNDGEKSVVPPDSFLDIAMKSGLYIEIAKKMLTQSLSFFSKRDEKISINLLPKDFLSPHIMDILIESIKEFETPQKIVIEITEQEGVDDFQRLVKVIKMLRDLGVLLAIDDFGSGYANYAHILALKPDYLKIDGSLIKKVLTDDDSRILVRNIINFAKDLNIIVVAEYIENKEIFELLRDYGVDEYQGYYFGRPIDLINE